MRNVTNIKKDKYSTGLLDAYDSITQGITFGEKLNKGYKKKKSKGDYVIYVKMTKRKRR